MLHNVSGVSRAVHRRARVRFLVIILASRSAHVFVQDKSETTVINVSVTAEDASATYSSRLTAVSTASSRADC